MRDLTVTCTLLCLAALTGIGLTRPVSPTDRASRPVNLQTCVLLQRESADGSWASVALRELWRGAQTAQAGDALQLTVQADEPSYLLVATRSGRELQVLYPLPGQSGEVRPGWAYALPDPSRTYTLDGEDTEVLVLASRDPLPRDLAQRRSVLRASAKRPARGHRMAPVQLQLRDGTPVPVEVYRHTGQEQVLALIPLSRKGDVP